jgi:hypothetical protein
LAELLLHPVEVPEAEHLHLDIFYRKYWKLPFKLATVVLPVFQFEVICLSRSGDIQNPKMVPLEHVNVPRIWKGGEDEGAHTSDQEVYLGYFISL